MIYFDRRMLSCEVMTERTSAEPNCIKNICFSDDTSHRSAFCVLLDIPIEPKSSIVYCGKYSLCAFFDQSFKYRFACTEKIDAWADKYTAIIQ